MNSSSQIWWVGARLLFRCWSRRFRPRCLRRMIGELFIYTTLLVLWLWFVNDRALSLLTFRAWRFTKASTSSVNEQPAQNSGQSSRLVLSTVISFSLNSSCLITFVRYQSPFCRTSRILPVSFPSLPLFSLFLSRARSWHAAAICRYSEVSVCRGLLYIFVKNRFCCVLLKFFDGIFRHFRSFTLEL